MGFKFKVGDKVRVADVLGAAIACPKLVGEEGIVTGLGGAATPDKGAVVTNEKFPCGDELYGKHGHWFPDAWLELV